jgi:hypothetical protein
VARNDDDDDDNDDFDPNDDPIKEDGQIPGVDDENDNNKIGNIANIDDDNETMTKWSKKSRPWFKRYAIWLGSSFRFER